MEFREKKVLIFGTGKSGIAAAELLQNTGAVLTVYDGNEKLTEEEVRSRSGAFSDAGILIGKLPEEAAAETEIAVLSPGVPLDCPEVLLLKEQKALLLGEIELGYLFGKGRLCAITGTNGKTTTTALTGALLAEEYEDVRVVGNIGNPYTSEAASMTDRTVTAAEISSFQLETADTFHPEAAAILNITPDHLNRHHTMEAYIAAKERIAENLRGEDVLVLNYEDPVLKSFGEQAECRVRFFSSERKVENGMYVRGKELVFVKDGAEDAWLSVDELQILGKHNWENACAAALLAEAMGVSKEKIIRGLKKFQAVEHRIEFAGEFDGVRYYNDSKGTNPDAAIKGITSMDRPTVLIGGGYDKGSEYGEWIKAAIPHMKKLILLGQTRESIAEECERQGFSEYELVDSLEEAVEHARAAARPGDSVLLSPACASWGMFKNFEERGNRFKELVRQ